MPDSSAVLAAPGRTRVVSNAPRRPRNAGTRDMPRERLFGIGVSALSDTELIAIFLGTGLPGHNVFDVARSLLARFGSLRAMLDSMLSQSRTQFEVLQDSARLRTDDPAVIRVDPSKLQRRTGWKPMVPIEQTLRDVLDYYRSIRGRT